MTSTAAIAVLAAPVLLAITVGVRLLRRALAREECLPEEMALAAAWVFVVGSLVWFGVYLSGGMLLGFGEPWTWLAALHFFFAGYGSLTVCRAVSNKGALKVLRALLFAHPVAYLVTAAGISGLRYCDELGAASYELIFIAQLVAFVFWRSSRIAKWPRFMLTVALIIPVVTLVPALAWAWGKPIFDLSGMVRFHGLVNAVGHVGLAFAAFAWGRPKSHSAIKVAGR